MHRNIICNKHCSLPCPQCLATKKQLLTRMKHQQSQKSRTNGAHVGRFELPINILIFVRILKTETILFTRCRD